ncbi:MAG TPA: molybdenum cofactor guanylyltransferase [Acidobacteriota bacterium]|nr:molybdenum cofactor guanylyltransferase [Acidobacteriota bacterium]
MVEATALVLAGGRSRRMGRDKRFLQVEGETLLKRTFDLAQEACRNVKVLISEPEDGKRISKALGLPSAPPQGESPLVADSRPGSGPLAAVREAAAHCTAAWILVLAVDYPALTSGFLEGLLERAQDLAESNLALVPQSGGRLQYACALYRRSALLKLARRNDPPSSFRSWLEDQPAVVVWAEEEWRPLASPDTLVNWNRPGDWRGP